MPCYHPLVGYRSKELTKNGKRKLVFNIKYAQDDGEITVPCGQCVGCRLKRSKQWAIRCVHEAQMHEENTYLTFTYRPEDLPYPPSLDHRHFQLFMKRFRKKYPDRNIRFYMCGEYGEETRRPHYHAIIFGFKFTDQKFYKQTEAGFPLYNSEILNTLWGKGNCIIGDVTFESAAYVARYIMKKVTGDEAEEHYKCVDEETGEAFDIKPEYTAMSRRPGIGKYWFDKYKKDVYPSDEVIINGKQMQPPKYYDTLLEAEPGEEIDYIKYQRELKNAVYQEEQTYERLKVKEKVKLSQLKQLKRSL